MHSYITRVKSFYIDIIILICCVSITMGLGIFPGKIDIRNTFYLKQIGISILFYSLFFWLKSAFYFHFNRPEISLSDDLKNLMKGGVFSIVSISLFFLLIETWRTGLKWVHITGIITLSALVVYRVLEWKVFRRNHKFLALFIGLEEYLSETLQEFRERLPSNWTLATAFNNGFEEVHYNDSVLRLSKTEIDNFFTFCHDNEFVPILILSHQLQDKRELCDFLRNCFSKGVSLVSLNHFYESVLEKVPLFRIEGKWVSRSEFVSPVKWRLIIKRLFDLTLAIILLIPSILILLICAITIKLESKGPAFFIQERIGRNKKAFGMIKLRTMKVHEDDSEKWPHVAEDQITKAGRIFRKTGIDELPQLINIILGHMSFVGPRPARTLVSQMHAEKIPFFALCYPIPPGITGWAQVHQGQDTSEESLFEKVRYNLYYSKNFSILFDLRVVLITIKLLFEIKKPKRYVLKKQVNVTGR